MVEDHKEEDTTDAGSFQGMCANTAQASNQYSQVWLGMSYSKYVTSLTAAAR